MEKKRGETTQAGAYDFPMAQQGEDGVRFIEKCVESSQKNSAWVELD